MGKLQACVLGSTGIVGQHFIRILENHPNFEVTTVTASQRSQGKEYRDATDWIVSSMIPESVKHLEVLTTDSDAILKQDVDIVFSALPSSTAFDIEARLAMAGLPIFSNAGAHRMDDDVPILIPEINPDHLELVRGQNYGDGFIITNSNCSTSGLVFGLKPLQKYGIKAVTVTTYQAVSGAGRKGISSIDILGNVIPFIPNEEEKMVSETKEILGDLCDGKVIPADFDVNASCVRVPVQDGHLESIVIDVEEQVEVEQIIDMLNNFSGEPQSLRLPTAPIHPIVVLNESNRPQPMRDLSLKEGDLGMTVKIGRLRRNGSRLNMFLLVHNTIRGAAGASVLNAEFALAKGVFE
ncbi:aspartate-semialdehyde dehydrogenase [Candidatus Thorarchaeota archaeon]|nr:MAG: aspartate-semialdehyde dehydrogenase [Candidatus Thorarchaeota archaeon]